MCLILKKTKPSMANEDMICYKILEQQQGILLSPFYHHLYKLNVLNPVIIIQECEDLCSYSTEDTDYLNEKYPEWNYNKESFQYHDLMSIGQGYHSISTLESAEAELIISIHNSISPVIVECTIPKGSFYYVGPTGLMVSDQIIVNKIIS